MMTMTRTSPPHKTERRKAETGPTPQPMDRLLFLLMLMLIGVGIVTVYDASYALAIEKGDSFHFVKRQALWAVVGWGRCCDAPRAVLALARGGEHRLALSAFLLVAVFVPHVGSSINGARRWIGHGQFQPSELAKLALVLYLARLLSTKPQEDACASRRACCRRCSSSGRWPALIAKEPDLGTALVLAATGLTLLFLAGARPRHMAGIVGAVGVAGRA